MPDVIDDLLEILRAGTESSKNKNAHFSESEHKLARAIKSLINNMQQHDKIIAIFLKIKQEEESTQNSFLHGQSDFIKAKAEYAQDKHWGKFNFSVWRILKEQKLTNVSSIDQNAIYIDAQGELIKNRWIYQIYRQYEIHQQDYSDSNEKKQNDHLVKNQDFLSAQAKFKAKLNSLTLNNTAQANSTQELSWLDLNNTTFDILKQTFPGVSQAGLYVDQEGNLLRQRKAYQININQRITDIADAYDKAISEFLNTAPLSPAINIHLHAELKRTLPPATASSSTASTSTMISFNESSDRSETILSIVDKLSDLHLADTDVNPYVAVGNLRSLLGTLSYSISQTYQAYFTKTFTLFNPNAGTKDKLDFYRDTWEQLLETQNNYIQKIPGLAEQHVPYLRQLNKHMLLTIWGHMCGLAKARRQFIEFIEINYGKKSQTPRENDDSKILSENPEPVTNTKSAENLSASLAEEALKRSQKSAQSLGTLHFSREKSERSEPETSTSTRYLPSLFSFASPKRTERRNTSKNLTSIDKTPTISMEAMEIKEQLTIYYGLLETLREYITLTNEFYSRQPEDNTRLLELLGACTVTVSAHLEEMSAIEERLSVPACKSSSETAKSIR